jgi:hypothetical protein
MGDVHVLHSSTTCSKLLDNVHNWYSWIQVYCIEWKLSSPTTLVILRLISVHDISHKTGKLVWHSLGSLSRSFRSPTNETKSHFLTQCTAVRIFSEDNRANWHWIGSFKSVGALQRYSRINRFNNTLIKKVKSLDTHKTLPNAAHSMRVEVEIIYT